jgi:hypothetical protein
MGFNDGKRGFTTSQRGGSTLFRALLGWILVDEGDLLAGYDQIMIAVRMPQNSLHQAAWAIGTAAHYALRMNALETAAVLYGSAEEIRFRLGWPPEASTLDKTDVEVLRTRLGEAYNQHHERGRSLSWEAALTLISDLGDSGA